ncbi:MAG: hypothetical protein U1C74_21645 [Phenylobacterium sp.]|nr:hypothetical protein [Phenylobacterium sp.]
MSPPIALPLGRFGRARPASPAAERIAGLVLRLEDEAAPSLMLTTLAVRAIGGVQAWVICHLADGAREKFSPSDARVLAAAMRDAAGFQVQLNTWADSLEEAAETAERQASAILLGQANGRQDAFGPSPMHPCWKGR